MEIIIVNGGSAQDEFQIIQSYQKNFPRIRYLANSKKESLYKAWNRGLEVASGEYITNANTDDRHHFECLERLVNKLEEHPDCDVAYGNLYKSTSPNELLMLTINLYLVILKDFTQDPFCFTIS